MLNGLATAAINLPMELLGLRIECLTAFREELAAVEKTLEDPEIREVVRKIAEIVEDHLRRDTEA